MLAWIDFKYIYIPASCIVVKVSFDAVTRFLSKLGIDLITDIIVVLVPAVSEVLMLHILLKALSAALVIDSQIKDTSFVIEECTEFLHNVEGLLFNVRSHSIRRIHDAGLEFHIDALAYCICLELGVSSFEFKQFLDRFLDISGIDTGFHQDIV